MRSTIVFLCFYLLIGGSQIGYATSFDRAAKRYEIDTKRIGVGYMSRDALPRGREFKQIDSTYYVGWMYEGAYLMDHAADLLGFQLAAQSMQKALQLMENDFNDALRTRTGDAARYIPIMQIHRDWDFIQHALYQSYTYSNQLEQAWNNLRKATSINLQDEFMTETYNLMAWTVHRNRHYTTADYRFLKNSIAENEAYAHALLDSSLVKIKRDQKLMESFLTINYQKEREPGIWHYRALLYSYALDIPKAAYCYKQLQETAYFPENNYATFNLIQGNFNEASHHYNKAKEQEGRDKRLKESYYYGSILDLYQNKIHQSVQEIKALIQENGTTPGFGWYQLALARLYLYNNQLHNASIALNKATDFHEIHMGTTLGTLHYQFTLSTLQIIRWNKLITLQHQADRYWWINPYKLWQSLIWYWNRYQDKLRWIDLMKNNPERENVIYNLFSSESTISFDEAITCIQGMSPQYFARLFKNKLHQDSLRPALTPYWHYAIAKQLIEKKQWKEALNQLNRGIIHIHDNKDGYQRLLSARITEAYIECLIATNQKVPTSYYLRWFEQFPQTILTSSIPFPIQCEYNNTPELAPIINALKKSNLNIVHNTQYPKLKLSVVSKKPQLKLNGDWSLPGENTPTRTCTWIINKTELTDESIFQAIFAINL
jgi:predicted negative regulator of RcsB-dependent stress response